MTDAGFFREGGVTTASEAAGTGSAPGVHAALKARSVNIVVAVRSKTPPPAKLTVTLDSVIRNIIFPSPQQYFTQKIKPSLFIEWIM